MKEIAHIKDLKPDQMNPRRRTERNLQMIEASLNEVGAARSIVVDEDGNILAGNGTIEAAALAGIEKVRVIEADGETIIAVRRSGLTEEQKRRLSLYDNRAAELAEWDAAVLGCLESETPEVTKGLFTEDELLYIIESELGETEQLLKEETERIRQRKMLHVLISVDVDRADEVRDAISDFDEIPGIEVLYGSN